MIPSPVIPPLFDGLVASGIAGITFAVAATFVALAAARSGRDGIWLGGVVTAVMGLSWFAGSSGYHSRLDIMPPPMAVVIACVPMMGLALGCSPVGRRLSTEKSLAVLVGVQAFRLPLELVMHRAAALRIMPEELTYTGYNFDIVTGIGACVLFPALRGGVPRWAVWAWNLWGAWCPAVILFVAVAASPAARAFGVDPRHVNTWVLFVPYVWLPVVLVTLAIAGHVLVTRSLWQQAARPG